MAAACQSVEEPNELRPYDGRDPVVGGGPALLPRQASLAPPLEMSSSSGSARDLKIHNKAERRRRERINAHLAVLRRMIPDAKQRWVLLVELRVDDGLPRTLLRSRRDPRRPLRVLERALRRDVLGELLCPAPQGAVVALGDEEALPLLALAEAFLVGDQARRRHELTRRGGGASSCACSRVRTSLKFIDGGDGLGPTPRRRRRAQLRASSRTSRGTSASRRSGSRRNGQCHPASQSGGPGEAAETDSKRRHTANTTQPIRDRRGLCRMWRRGRSLYMKALVSWDDRPDLLGGLVRALHGLWLRTVRAEVASLGGRVQHVFTLCSQEEEGSARCVGLGFMKEAVRHTLAKVASPDLVYGSSSGSFSLQSKRQRIIESHCSILPV
ncbi:unnamed protein product [Alopecurus aequalis]